MKKLAHRLTKIMVLTLGLLLLCAGCTTKFAEEVEYVISFAHGANHYNGFWKTAITVDANLVLQYHLYAADADDSTIYYSGTQPAGIPPKITVEATITPEDWQALAGSKPLARVWNNSLPMGTEEGAAGASVSVLIVGTAERAKSVGGYVTDDLWLYESTMMLDHLALSSGARAKGDEKVAEWTAQSAREQEQEKQAEESADE